MKAFLVFGSKSKSGYRLIPLHKSHDNIAPNQDKALYNPIAGDDLVRLREIGRGDVSQGGGHRKANLDYRRRNTYGRTVLSRFQQGRKALALILMIERPLA